MGSKERRMWKFWCYLCVLSNALILSLTGSTSEFDLGEGVNNCKRMMSLLNRFKDAWQPQAL